MKIVRRGIDEQGVELEVGGVLVDHRVVSAGARKTLAPADKLEKIIVEQIDGAAFFAGIDIVAVCARGIAIDDVVVNIDETRRFIDEGKNTTAQSITTVRGHVFGKCIVHDLNGIGKADDIHATAFEDGLVARQDIIGGSDHATAGLCIQTSAVAIGEGLISQEKVAVDQGVAPVGKGPESTTVDVGLIVQKLALLHLNVGTIAGNFQSTAVIKDRMAIFKGEILDRDVGSVISSYDIASVEEHALSIVLSAKNSRAGSASRHGEREILGRHWG